MPTGNVKNITLNADQRAQYNLNRIDFEGNYFAMEKSVNGGSEFKVGKTCDYTVTHPGKEGKLDWIRYNESLTTPMVQTFLDKRDILIISQNAMTNAVNFAQGRNMTDGDVVAKAMLFAEATIINAQKLASKYLKL